MFITRDIKVVAVVILMLMSVTACERLVYEDVSEQPTFKPIVGSAYKIIGVVEAYGVRKHSKATIERIILMPPSAGLGGLQFVFIGKLKLGTHVVVKKVLLTNDDFFQSPYVFEVEYFGNEGLPSGMPIHIDLFRGNEGEAELSLNPKIYQKVVISVNR